MIAIRDLVWSAGGFRLEVALEVSAGEYVVIMGPTGAGKTALVECIAGLRKPAGGRVEIGGEDVTLAEPRLRSVGYVPQDHALFAHRNVRRNIGFGPEARRWPRDEARRAVDRAAALAGIRHLLDRRIAGLSGGERQRVALARALAVRPRVLILDEPVSALDEVTRQDILRDLRRLQRELGLTTIHVSHNLEETLTVADRVVLLRAGRVEQEGAAADVLRRPRTEFAARFLRAENIFMAEADEGCGAADETRARLAGVLVRLPGRHRGSVRFVVRPEHIFVTRPGDELPGDLAASFPARLSRRADLGASVRLELAAFQPIVAHVPPAEIGRIPAEEGAEVLVGFRGEAIHVLPQEVQG